MPLYEISLLSFYFQSGYVDLLLYKKIIVTVLIRKNEANRPDDEQSWLACDKCLTFEFVQNAAIMEALSKVPSYIEIDKEALLASNANSLLSNLPSTQLEKRVSFYAGSLEQGTLRKLFSTSCKK